MREIKFKIFADSKWYDKCLVGNTNDTEDDKWTCPMIWIDDKKEWVNCDNGIVCQYTGLKDKNGVEIYEGDIVQWADIKMEIFWGQDIGMGYGFCWRPYGEEQFYHESMTGFIDEYEVIGNIYENKLKEEGK